MSLVRSIAALCLAVLLAALLTGCGQSTSDVPPAEDTGASGAAASQSSTEPVAADDGLHVGAYKVTGKETVVVTTNKGKYTIELYPDKAPNTVSSFLELVDAKFYDGIRVHRVEPDFVMQVGDPQSKGLTAKEVQEVATGAAAGPQLGTGGPGWTMKAEFNDLKHERGVVAMARSQEVDSAGSQIYVTLAPAYSLDGQYTVFGRVIEGMDVVDKLGVGDIITSARIVTGK